MYNWLPLPTIIAGVAFAGGLFLINRAQDKNADTVSTLINKDFTRRLIAENEEEDWKKSWLKYKASSGDIWKLGSGNEVPKALKDKCKSRLETKAKWGVASEVYEKFVSYCVRDTRISDLLKDQKLVLLSKDGNGDEEGWKQSWQSYIDENKESTDVWKVADFQTKKDQKDTVPEAFKTSCSSNLGSNSIFNTLLIDQVKKWCTKTQEQK
ncbi:hypothetical protein MHF_1320 [Mycoplasma haemofelis Ohio2]|uniref:Uncharacterized protein n=1 Tax=Mycoplasma haemofelis (strain Ohio2) TaxID=859194 RepID=F6FG58_MYCHI|nr:hypothetical protein MHF_1320 [Mycoplasma haemofelis Ohio2]